MKKLFILLLMATPYSLQAQEYRKFFFGIDIGAQFGENSGIGSLTFEPSFRLNDKMSIGLRLEQAGLISLIGSSNPSLASIGLSYHYYLPIKSSRLFVGGGVAIYNPSNNIFFRTPTQKINETYLVYFQELESSLVISELW